MLSTSLPHAASPSPNRSIAFLAVASLASQAMVRAADTLLPQIATDFGITVGAASIVITVYALTHGTFQLIVGPIGDRIGKYRSVAIACALSAVTVSLCGLAQSLDQLTLARIASGLTAAWILPLGLAYIGDVVPYARRQQVLGRFLAGQVLGQLFGQAAGGVIGDHFGWRSMFFVLGAMFALAAIALTYELLTNPVTRAAGGRRQASRGLRADYASVLTNPWTRFVLLVTFLEAVLLQGVFPFVGADLHLRFGLSFTAIGLIIGVFGIGGLIYAATVSRLVQSLGQTGIALTGGIAMGLAFFVLAIQPNWWPAPFAVIVIGLGFYMMHNTLQTVATQMTPEARGTSIALFASVYFQGQTVGVALAAPIMDRFGGPVLFTVSAVLLPLLALWCIRRLKRRS
jgi:MFS transporter, YNFM family, putative membrane transport protein